MFGRRKFRDEPESKSSPCPSISTSSSSSMRNGGNNNEMSGADRALISQSIPSHHRHREYKIDEGDSITESLDGQQNCNNTSQYNYSGMHTGYAGSGSQITYQG